jgi:hypothetical protein
VVEKGVASLAVLVQTWVAFMRDDSKQQMIDIALVLSNLLQQAWLIPVELMVNLFSNRSIILSYVTWFNHAPVLLSWFN